MSDHTPFDYNALMKIEIIGKRLCIDVAGKDDYEIFKNPEGNTEFAFSTPLDNMEKMALHLLERVKEVRAYNMKKEKENAQQNNGGLR